jgi:farnesyl diphosphate synthase
MDENQKFRDDKAWTKPTSLFDDYFNNQALVISEALKGYLGGSQFDETDPDNRLFSAMRYGALGPGKRLRPFLTLEAARLLGAPIEAALRIGCALELIHAYSLIHDDLPSMDDDDFRRGRPTVHKVYDEATAILAGDGLLTKAFEIITLDDGLISQRAQVSLIRLLARAAGAQGMVGGQMLDIMANSNPSFEQMQLMQGLKTGALIAASIEAPICLCDVDESWKKALASFGSDLGLLFQIIDDILDAEGDPAVMGKAASSKDKSRGKANFVTILGIEAAKLTAKSVKERALEALTVFEFRAQNLRETVDFVTNRSH